MQIIFYKYFTIYISQYTSDIVYNARALYTLSEFSTLPVTYILQHCINCMACILFKCVSVYKYIYLYVGTHVQ
jgi:hypothetical protein